MKRILFTTFAACLIALSAWADGTEINGIYYNLDSTAKTATVTYTGSNWSENNYLGDITIPATITYGGTTYSVTSIGSEAFHDCTGLTSITIRNSFTSIGFEAFINCSGLTSITIPNSVTSIGEKAFYGCTGLKSIKVEEGNTKYDSRDNCNAIIETASNTLVAGCKATTIPNSVTSIGRSAFSGCTGLTSITFPSSVTSIGYYAFNDCSGLTSITIPNSVTSIVGDAFSGCTGLTSIKVEEGNTKYDSRDNCNAIISTATNTLIAGCKATTIPNSVTNIGQEAFSGCTGLTSITIPNSVTTIGQYAFQSCTGLTSITIPNSITSIEWGTFYYCEGLTSITIPNSVTYIDREAFYHCTSLTSITIPNSVTIIGDNAFGWCTSLTSITIPNSVTTIGSSAFYDCTSLTSITIPNSVTSIGDAAFWYCTGLTSIKVETGNTKYDSRDNCNAIIETATNTLIAGCKATTIPNSVTTIGSEAFRGCTSLTSITIPNSVSIIGNGAFSYCNGLTSVTIPNSVTIIGNSAFRGCKGLTSITLSWGDPTNCIYGTSMLDGVPTSATLYVPAGTKVRYENTEPWSSFENIADRGGTEINGIYYSLDGTTKTATVTKGKNYSDDITIPATVTYGGTTYSVTSIGSRAFAYCSGLTSITIPNSVTSIGDFAFSGCTSLTSITIPNSVTSIGNYAFEVCTGLTSIKVAAGNTKYDSRDNCNAIIETASNTLEVGCKATTIPSSVTSIGGRGAFWGCTGLTSITIPNSVTIIGSSAFVGCTGLTSITIPNSVTSIGGWAFSGCTGLTSITIPNSVTTIGQYAFQSCTGLTSITIPNSVTSIGDRAFSGCTGLTSITLSWDDPTNCTYGDNMLLNVPTSATLSVPAGTKALYENTEPWSSFENIVEREKSVITLSNTMGTYCDASGLDFSSVEGLEAYTATGYASGEVTLTRVNYVPANTGLVLRGTAGVYEVPQQKVNAYLTNLLKGTTSPITLNQTEGDMTNYILANGSKGIGFYKVASGGGTLAANKAYLQLPSNLSATRPMMLRFEDEDGQTTDIQYLYTSSDDETAPAIFDLQGRRVSGTMQQGGIYIVGGKKVIVKSH